MSINISFSLIIDKSSFEKLKCRALWLFEARAFVWRTHTCVTIAYCPNIRGGYDTVISDNLAQLHIVLLH